MHQSHPLPICRQIDKDLPFRYQLHDSRLLQSSFVVVKSLDLLLLQSLGIEQKGLGQQGKLLLARRGT